VIRLASLIVPARQGKLAPFSALAIAQFILAATFLMARRVRRTTFGVIEQLERAVRTVAQREAPLDEGNRELDRALRIGGPGRYADQEIGRQARRRGRGDAAGRRVASKPRCRRGRLC
jgi:hypothetical protein